MQMQKMKRIVIGLFVALAIIGSVFVVDHVVRCNGKPLTRDEALQRASAKLKRFSQKFVVGDATPELVEEHYDDKQKVWMFTFRGKACEIIILADRCHGTDIGGTNGCSPR